MSTNLTGERISQFHEIPYAAEIRNTKHYRADRSPRSAPLEYCMTINRKVGYHRYHESVKDDDAIEDVLSL